LYLCPYLKKNKKINNRSTHDLSVSVMPDPRGQFFFFFFFFLHLFSFFILEMGILVFIFSSPKNHNGRD
jgi:hypothetical protein